MTTDEMLRFLDAMKNVRALVIGDLMLDKYVWGQVDRISPEAPVPIVRVQDEGARLGGSGNVVSNLHSLGCYVDLVAVLGDDEDGQCVQHILKDHGIDTQGLVTVPGRTTTRKTRVLASNQQILRIDREMTTSVAPDVDNILLSHVARYAPKCQVILVSDYAKGGVSTELLDEVFSVGKKLGIPVVVDPKGHDFRKYQGATVLTPNRKETQIATGMAIVDNATLCAAGHFLRDLIHLDYLVLTRSDEGMSIFGKNDVECHMTTEAREVFDVSGAGDTVVALLGAGLAAGFSIFDSAEAANIAAGIVVGKIGTAPVTVGEFIQAVEGRTANSDSKIVNLNSLRLLVDRERRRGKHIVFTNGCFDLLHVGHVKYLEEAKKTGDMLILGLNSDASVRRIKGAKRPLLGQDDRAHLLGALQCIDYVVIFDEDTPLELIAAVRPDVLVKGSDYTKEAVVGKDLVESYGGRVELINVVAGRSTSQLVETIRDRYRDE